MLSSRLPVPGRANPGESCATSSLESLKKLLQTLLAMLEPLGGAAQGAMCELALVAVGGLRDMEGTLAPEVSSTASCLRWSPKTLAGVGSQLEGLRRRCEGSFGGGAGGTVPGEMSDSFSTLHGRVSSETGRDGARQGWKGQHVRACFGGTSSSSKPRQRHRSTVHEQQRQACGAQSRGSGTRPMRGELARSVGAAWAQTAPTAPARAERHAMRSGGYVRLGEGLCGPDGDGRAAQRAAGVAVAVGPYGVGGARTPRALRGAVAGDGLVARHGAARIEGCLRRGA